jgi:tetratricopeptide (TPR) repeat protein
LYQLHAGKWNGALGHFTRSVQTFRDAGDLRRAALATTLVAWVLRITGALASSLQHSGELLRLGQEAGDPQVLAWGHAEQGRVFLQTGALDEAVVHLREAAALANRVADYVWVVDANSCLATCCLRQGKLQEALELTDLSVRLADAHDVRGYNRTLLLTARAEVCLAAAERADPTQRALWFKRARQACRTLVKQGRIDAEAVPVGLRLHGTYQWLRGRRTAAEWLWRRSVEVAERLGAKYELGLAYQEIGMRTDRRLHLEQARAIFDQIGARRDLAYVQDRLQRAG